MFTLQTHMHLALHQTSIATGDHINTCLLKRMRKWVESSQRYGFPRFNVWRKRERQKQKEWLREATSIMYTPTTSIKHLSRKINVGTDDVLRLSFLTDEMVCLEATHTLTHTHTHTHCIQTGYKSLYLQQEYSLRSHALGFTICVSIHQ